MTKKKTTRKKRKPEATSENTGGQLANDLLCEKNELLQRARSGHQQAIYDLRQRGWVNLIDEIDFVFNHAMTGGEKAKETLLHVFSHVTRLMEDAADKTKSPDFAQQVASSALNLTDTLEGIVDQRPEVVADFAAHVALWPVLACVTGKPRYDFDATVKRRLKLGNRLPFRVKIPMKKSYNRVLRDLLSGCVLDYETKQYSRLPRPPLELWYSGGKAERIESMTDYAMVAFDGLMGGAEWNADTFKRKFPIREWMGLPERHDVMTTRRNSLRNAARSEIVQKIEAALSDPPEQKRKR